MTNPGNPLILELETARAELRSAWESVPLGHRATPPGPGDWSPSQVLEHLAITLGQVVRLAWRQWDGRGELKARPLDASPGHGLDPLRVEDRSRKYTAPDFTLPGGGSDPEECWARLEEGLARLKALAEASVPYDVSGLSIPHPLLGSLDLHQWILFAARHERRHAGQLREAAEAFAGD